MNTTGHCLNPPENSKDKPFKAIIAIDFGTDGCGKSQLYLRNNHPKDPIHTKKTNTGVAFSIAGSDEIYIEPNMWSRLADVDPSRPSKRQIKVKTKTSILLNPQNKLVEFGSLGYNTLSN